MGRRSDPSRCFSQRSSRGTKEELDAESRKRDPALPQGGGTCQHNLQRWQPIATRVQEGPHIDMSLFMVVVNRGHPPDACSVLPLAGAEEELR
ncbi:hypothetical protein MRX96_046949 [Rhipicephalus microplus]